MIGKRVRVKSTCEAMSYSTTPQKAEILQVKQQDTSTLQGIENPETSTGKYVCHHPTRAQIKFSITLSILIS